MNRYDPDELLWELSSVDSLDLDSESEEGSLSMEVLEAWRAGRLGEAEAARVESALAHHRATRERLHQMASVEPPSPPEALRSRILASLASKREETKSAQRWTKSSRGRPKRAFLRGWVPQVAALAAAGVLALGLYLQAGGSAGRKATDLPAEMEFMVSAEMLTEVRSETSGRGFGFAYAETRVRIVVEPQEEARAGLEFAIYRDGGRGQGFERLATGADIVLEQGRGTASFEAPAWRFVGAEPGSRDLFVAVASTGRLPDVFDVPPGEEASTVLAKASGGRVYRHTISVFPDPG